METLLNLCLPLIWHCPPLLILLPLSMKDSWAHLMGNFYPRHSPTTSLYNHHLLPIWWAGSRSEPRDLLLELSFSQFNTLNSFFTVPGSGSRSRIARQGSGTTSGISECYRELRRSPGGHGMYLNSWKGTECPTHLLGLLPKKSAWSRNLRSVSSAAVPPSCLPQKSSHVVEQSE